MKTALSIAGTDPSGGAGIQADLKTMTMHGVYGMSAITALVAQNTTGVRAIQEVSPDFLGQQLDVVFEDIFPDAIKIGMVSSSDLIMMIAQKLIAYQAKNIIVDPVMVANSGSNLIKTEAIQTLSHYLFPLATLITPNIPEAQVLSGMTITTKQDMLTAAKQIATTYHCAILLKGGHRLHDADDLIYIDGEIQWFNGQHIDTVNTHGTGCTLSSAIASNLALGFDLIHAIERAKDYVSSALSTTLNLGKGSGPLNHCFDLSSKFATER